MNDSYLVHHWIIFNRAFCEAQKSMLIWGPDSGYPDIDNALKDERLSRIKWAIHQGEATKLAEATYENMRKVVDEC